MKKPIFVIEHLEPELYEWCEIEYKHISKIVGSDALWITNLKKDHEKLKNHARVFQESISELKMLSPCILDPDASETLSPADKDLFDFFIFGGILGDHPPKKRTKVELTEKIPNVAKRNLGNKQFSTDNAVFVAKEIINGIPLSQIPFQDGIEIPLRDGESNLFPYRYALVNKKPLVSPELVTYLKNKKGF